MTKRRASARNRPFTVALTVSALLHLSMVTVFSIVIYFPTRNTEYYSVDIVRDPAARTLATEPESTEAPLPGLGKLSMRSPDQLIEGSDLGAVKTDGSLSGGGLDALVAKALEPPDSWADLPDIDLPRLEFDALERVRSREQGLQIRRQYTDIFERQPQDSWARFSGQLRGLGGALARLARLEDDGSVVAPRKISTPAPGYAMYIEWMSAPLDRELLFSPPIKALREVDASRLAAPITLVFSVNAQGKVTDVQVPFEDEEGVASSVGGALLQYRFAPTPVGGPEIQRGTLIVAGEDLVP